MVTLICERNDKKVARATKYEAIVLERLRSGPGSEHDFISDDDSSSEDLGAAPSRVVD